jgi:hypothetical protein
MFILKCNFVFLGAFFYFALTSIADSQSGPKDGVVLIIRHAEKPDVGSGLSAAGQQRSLAYGDYFQKFTVDSEPLSPDVIFAAKDSKTSKRPRLTVEQFAKATNLKIDTRFRSDEGVELAAALGALPSGRRVLICWRHTDIPSLLRALGAKPKRILPGGKWPDPIFDWVLVLRFDQDGRLIPGSARRIDEHLMPGDSQ